METPVVPKPSSGLSGELVLAVLLAIVPWGLSLIGVQTNIWLGGAMLLAAFGLATHYFWVRSLWSSTVRSLFVVLAAVVFLGWVAMRMRDQYRAEHQTHVLPAATNELSAQPKEEPLPPGPERVGTMDMAAPKKIEEPAVRLTVKRAPAISPPPGQKAPDDLLIEFQIGPIPTSAPDGRIYALPVFPLPVASGGGGLVEYSSPTNEFKWTDPDHPMMLAQKYRITNYCDKPLTNIEMTLHLTFQEAKIQEGGGLTSGAVTLSRDWLITIQKIDPGPANAFVFYAFNNVTPHFVLVELPDQATAQVIGETSRRAFRVIHAKGQIMPLSPFIAKP